MDYVLSLPIDRRIAVGIKAQEFKFKHIEDSIVYKQIIVQMSEHLFSETGK